MRLRFLPLLLLPLLLASCSTFARREGVQVSLVNLALGESTVWETELHCTVRLLNESPVPLAFDGAVHKIYLNGTYVGEGLINERLEIPRLGTVTQAVVVHLSNFAMLTKVREIVDAQALDYRISSVIHTARGRFHAGREGRLDLQEFQPAAR